MAIVIGDEGAGLKEDGIWGSPMDGVKMQIRRIDGDIFLELRKPFIKKSFEVDRKTRKMAAVDIVDEDAFSDAVLDYIIQDFKGFIDKNRYTLPVNLESKKRIMNKTIITEWVWSMAQSLEVAEQEKQEAEEKNS